MDKIHRNKHMFSVLSESNPKLRKLILLNCPPNPVNTLSEIAYNTVNGNIKLGKDQVDELRKHKKTIRCLAKCCYTTRNGKHKVDTNRARKILSQRGGLLPLLPLLALIGPIAAKAAVGGLVASGVGAIVKKATGT